MSTLIEYDSILQYYVSISTVISLLIFVVSENIIHSLAWGYMPLTVILSLFLEAFPNLNPNIWEIAIRSIVLTDITLLIFSISKVAGLVFIHVTK